MDCKPAFLPPGMCPPDPGPLEKLIIDTCGLQDLLGCGERLLAPDREAARLCGYGKLSDVPPCEHLDGYHPEAISCDNCKTSLSALGVLHDGRYDFCTTCWLKMDAQTRQDNIDAKVDRLYRLLDAEDIALLANANAIQVCALLARAGAMDRLGADDAAAMREALQAWSTRTPPPKVTAPLVISMREIQRAELASLSKILGCLAAGIPVKVVCVDVQSTLWHPSRVLEMEESVRMIDMGSPHWPFDAEDATTQLNPGQFANGYDDNVKVKLKDFPADRTFRDAAPQHFMEFVAALNDIAAHVLNPKGRLNMARVLTDQVDISAKFYVSGGSPEGSGCMTATGLHIDISEACNLMVHAREQLMRRYGVQIAALWYIFPRDCVDTVNEVLRERYPHFQDPIGSRVVCMTPDDIAALRSRGVRVWEVSQSVGEAVLVPSGCPHQVNNLAANSKIACDMALTLSAHALLDRQEAMRAAPQEGLDTLATSQLVLRAIVAALRSVCELTHMSESLTEPLIE